MTHYKAPVEDVEFILNKVLNAEVLWRSLAGLEAVDSETASAILVEAGKIAEQVLAPLNREADEHGCRWDNGQVHTPEGFKSAYAALREGGWCGLGGNPNYGGMGMPKSLVAAVEEMIQGSCMSFGLAPMLTAGACLAIDAHASKELKQAYLPNMYSGQWAGSMDLTEPHCGTDLGLLRARAEPNDDGSYRVSGTKIFITWGEHDMAENIIHLVLARLPDAPVGTKGISLFLVPKILVDDDGQLADRNTLSCGSLEKKMGIKASATCVMNYDQAKGWLVGEANRGLAAMFTMMNYERLTVGIQGIGVAEHSYLNALQYGRDRLQGRNASGVSYPDKAADPIIVHADVRRMLLNMKAMNEASRAFYLYVAQWLDIEKYSDDEQKKTQARDRVSLLTPIAKAFITDRAFDSCVDGQQVFGGHGFIREWGQEQHVRDVRITQIYEGTNGIQAMDLVGRKTILCQGALIQDQIAEIDTFIERAVSVRSLMPYCKYLKLVTEQLEKTTHNLVAQGREKPHLMGAVAVDYLNFCGYALYGFMWLKMAYACETEDVSPMLKTSKLKLIAYYFSHLLPQYLTLNERINAGESALTAFEDGEF